MRAILLLDPNDVARAPLMLCAESAEEAQTRHLPLFTTAFAQLAAGVEVRNDGTDDFELFDKGQRIGWLVTFWPPPF